MDHDESLSDRRKREKKFRELSRRNQEWTNKELDRIAEFLLDLWHWKQEQGKEKDESGENGSIPTGQ